MATYIMMPFSNTGQDLYDFITFINFAFEIYLHSKAFVRLLHIAFDLGARMFIYASYTRNRESAFMDAGGITN